MSMGLSCSTEYYNSPRFVMPAQAGIQDKKGMDTGVRRYDGFFLRIRRLDRNAYLFSKRHEDSRS